MPQKFSFEQIPEPLKLTRVKFLPWCCNRHIRFPHIVTTICHIKFPWSRIDCELLPLDSYMVCLGALACMVPWILSLTPGLLDCGYALLRIDGCWNKATAVAVLLPRVLTFLPPKHVVTHIYTHSRKERQYITYLLDYIHIRTIYFLKVNYIEIKYTSTL